jgi:aminoglycoside phosphotransferase (APT) family kinase protein
MTRVPEIDAGLARRLVAAQFPQWAGLPVRPVAAGGWDNRTFRLGDDMSLRLPSAQRYVEAVDKEQRWLPHLAPCLPLPVPVPLARGEPGEGYPFPWSVLRWIDGDPARPDRIGDPAEFARALAAFLIALRGIDAGGGPRAGAHSFHRGAPPAFYDGETRAAIAALGASVPAAAATAAWEAALAAAYDGPPVWFHGDVAMGNLLVDADGRLSAVIDFGTSGVGDPACDLTIAWTLFSGAGREAFRAAIPADAAMWARARGWALWKALITIAGGDRGDPDVVASWPVLEAVLAEATDANTGS